MAGGLVVQSPRHGHFEQECEKSPLISTRSSMIVSPSSASSLIAIKRTEPSWSNNVSDREKISMFRCTSTTSAPIMKSYGTMVMENDKRENSIFGSAGEGHPEVEVDLRHKNSSNQSETESDSDTSSETSVLIIHQNRSCQPKPQRLQSILRIPSMRSLEKKQSSVMFSIDIMSDSEEDEATYKEVCTKERKRRHKNRNNAFGSRCIPRYVFFIPNQHESKFVYCSRLTMDEKADLYRIRPDLEQSSICQQDLEEQRRKKQRRLVFSGLAGTLLLFMIIVFYYILIQM